MFPENQIQELEKTPRGILKEQAEENLLRWEELTALCLEFRKAGLAHRGLTDQEAEGQMWAEIRATKELAWKAHNS